MNQWSSIGCIKKSCYWLIAEPQTWQEANDTCRSRNDTYLATIPDNHTRVYLYNMTSQHIWDAGAWVGGYEVLLDTWTWLNGNKYYEGMTLVCMLLSSWSGICISSKRVNNHGHICSPVFMIVIIWDFYGNGQLTIYKFTANVNCPGNTKCQIVLIITYQLNILKISGH